jgi:hypothetical protein
MEERTHIRLIIAAGLVVACGPTHLTAERHTAETDAQTGEHGSGGTGGARLPANHPGGASAGGTTSAAGGTMASGGTLAAGGGIGTSGGTAGTGTSDSGVTPVCSLPYQDCNGSPADGCETDITIDEKNCGTCGNACPTPQNASPTCFVGTCGFFACVPHFGDCDGQPQNGCEQDLLADAKNCGACGLVCGSGVCRNGGCDCAYVSVRMQATLPGGCEYVIPPAAGGGPWDYLKLNVVVSAADGGAPTVPAKRPDSGACDAATGGWFYDDLSSPTRIVLCSFTCDSVNANPGTTVDVAQGCGPGD